MQRHGTLALVAVLTLALASGWALGQGRRGRRGRRGGSDERMRGPSGRGGFGDSDMRERFGNLSEEQRRAIARIREAVMVKMRSARSREEREQIMRGAREAIQKIVAGRQPKSAGRDSRGPSRGRPEAGHDRYRSPHGRPETSARAAPQSGACPHCGAVGGRRPKTSGYGRSSSRYERPSPRGHGQPRAHGAPKGRHGARGMQAKRSRGRIGDRIRQFLAQRAQMMRSRGGFGHGRSASRFGGYGGHGAPMPQHGRPMARGGFQRRPQPTPFGGRPSPQGGFGRGARGGRFTPVPWPGR